MSREIERQSEKYAFAPHLEDLPDSAYHQPTHLPAGHEDYNERTRRHEPDPYEHNTPDENSGYNWGPPPDPNHLHDPGFHEDETDPFPFE